MTEKKEPQYIGRYGEVLEDVKEIEDVDYLRYTFGYNGKIDSTKRFLEGIGVDEKGKRRKVVFEVSKKTNKKKGRYLIYDTKTEEECHTPISRKNTPEVRESCSYLNDVLHGPHDFWSYACLTGGSYKTIYFLRGKQLEGEEGTGIWADPKTFGAIEVKERREKSEKAHDIRKFLEDASIVEAIKTGDPVKVRNAAARVAMRSAKKKDME